MAKTFEWETADPAVEPVTLTEAIDHLRTVDDLERPQVEIAIVAARQYAERATSRAFIRRTFREDFTKWEYPFRLRLPDVSAVGSVVYTDADGAEQTLASSNYVLDSRSLPSCVLKSYSGTYPTLRTSGVAAPIQITYTAGYGTTAGDVPEQAKQAILLLVGHYYENRGDETTVDGVRAINSAKHLLGGVSWGEYR